MIKVRQRVIIAGVGTLLVGVAASEYLARRVVTRRYHQAREAHQRLEQHVGAFLVSHRQLADRLANEQRRSNELSSALASTREELERAVGRLAEETKTVRGLQQRVAAMQQHMDQLQGELAVTLQERQEAALSSSAPVQLERIVVTDPAATGLRGRVLSVHRDWNFVVIDFGWNDVKIGETISIFRNDQLLAKARIERVQEQVCAATILPEWNTTEVQVNDVAKLL